MCSMPTSIARLLLAMSLCLLVGCVTLPTSSPSTENNADPGQGDQASTIASGLREALLVGIERTVERTGRLDGYLANELIRISLPQELEAVSERLHQVGLGAQMDNLELAMNRAAEQAAGEATAIFIESIRRLRPEDVRAILNGGPDAATRYLRRQSEQNLRDSYQPIVHSRMTRVNAYGYYHDLVRAWNRLPLVQPLTLELEDYVTQQALDGLFRVLAQEEERIRQDPLARTTDLLRRVLGNN